MIGLRTRVDYLREAMPFDRVQVDMRLRSLSRCGAVLGFEYYRLLPDAKRQKLSVGEQEIAWVERASDGSPVATRFPLEIRRAFEEAPAQGPRQAVIRTLPALLSTG
jgi:acyl-CoA thioesterase FadM